MNDPVCEKPSPTDSGLGGVIRRRWQLIVICTLAGMAVAVLVILSLKPRYTADAILLLSTRVEHLSDLKSVVSGPLPAIPDTNVARGEVEVLQGRNIVVKVIRTLNLQATPDFAPHFSLARSITQTVLRILGQSPSLPALTAPQQETAAIDTYLKRFNAFNDGRSFTLSLSYTSSDPALAARVANTHAALYLDEQRMLKRDAAERAARWLTVELARLHQELQTKEQAIQTASEQAGLVGSAGSTGLERQVTDIGTSLAQAEAEVAFRHARLTASQQAGSDSQADVLGSDLIHKLREREAQTQQNLTTLAQSYGNSYPGVLAARSSLADITAKIDRESARIVHGLSTDYTAALQRKSDLAAMLGTLEQQRDVQARRAAEVDRLHHDAQTTRTVYEGLLGRLSEVRAQMGAEEPDARLISYATPPVHPSFPNIPLFSCIGLLVSALSGVGLAWLMEARLVGVICLDEVSALNVPSLEAVPNVKRRTRKGLSLPDLLLAHPKSVLSDQIRALRCQIALQRSGKTCHTLVLTSAMPGEGKTTTALLIGRSMAVAGLHVLVVECDLRRPEIARQLGLDGETGGLIAVLRDGLPLAQAITEDASAMHLLLAGKTTIRPQDLLSLDALPRMLDEARRIYDYILIDTPPLGAVSDALLVAAHADSTLFVVKWRSTPAAAARSIIGKLTRHKMPVSGVILTQTDLQRATPYRLASLYHASRAYPTEPCSQARRCPMTVIILTKNEEATIRRCVASVDWADEVLVFDSCSDDQTVEIARKLGATVAVQPWLGWVPQRQAAAALARHDWVMSVESDEVLDAELRDGIIAALSAEPDPRDGYVVDRRDEYFGRLFPNMKRRKLRRSFVRLYTRQHSHFRADDLIHERVHCPGRMIMLPGKLLHWRAFTLAEQLERYIGNAPLEAEMMEREDVRAGPARIFVKPMLRFLWSYVFCGGFRLGTTGLVQAMMVSHAEFVRNAMLWERQNVQRRLHPPDALWRGEPDRAAASLPVRETV